jgi:endonuclease/exonuclease/phosphatase family metal-dependent hydrolase
MYNIGMDAYSLAEALQDTNHELPDLADAVVTGDFNSIKQAVNEYAFHHNTRNARNRCSAAQVISQRSDPSRFNNNKNPFH